MTTFANHPCAINSTARAVDGLLNYHNSAVH